MVIHNAAEYLQKAMSQKVLDGLYGVKGILVHGRNRKEQKKDVNLRKLCERFRLLNLTTSPNNCHLGVTD